MIIGPKLIAVDDNPDHLAALSEGFDSLGGSCLTMPYDHAVVREEPFGRGIRVVFMDIHLMPGAPNQSSARTFSPLLQIIRKVVHPDNGPYALVTWTENQDKHDELMQFISTTLEPQYQPCASMCLDKSVYLGDVPALAQRLTNMRAELPGLAMLLEWEQAVARAADHSVSEIVGLTASHGLKAGESVLPSVRSICEATAGKTEAAKAPFRAFSTGMVSLLADRLDNLSPNAQQEAEWAVHVNAAGGGALNANQNAALNTFLHVAKTEDADEPAPGTVYPIAVSDFIQYLKPKFASASEAVLAGEFFPLKSTIATPQTDAHREQREEFEAALKSRKLKWCFIQLGAFCDQVQGKARVCAGVLAARIPESMIKYTDLVYKKREYRETPSSSEWLFQTPMLAQNGDNYVLVANLRFNLVFAISELESLMPWFRLRELLTGKITQVNSRHNTRIGLVEFRGA